MLSCYHQTTIPTFGIRVGNLLEDVDTSVTAVSKLYNREPWMMQFPHNLRSHKKSQTHPLEFIGQFKSIQNRYSNYNFIYTDGSKDNEKVGSAAVFANQILLECIPDYASIFSGELHALLLALNLIKRSRYSMFVICTDSLLALQAIENIKLETLWSVSSY